MELVEAEELSVGRLRSRRTWLRASAVRETLLERLGFVVERGGSYAVVSESREALRCLAMALLKEEPPLAGSVRIAGIDLAGLPERSFRPLRRRVQALFPLRYGQLPPLQTVQQSFAEVLRAWHGGTTREERDELVESAMIDCGLSEAVRDLFPAELDDLERQLAALARALLPGPDLLVCLGPAEGLDAVAARELAERLRRLREDRRIALLLLVDDIAVAAALADGMAVCHRGRLVEQGDAAAILALPAHDHTRRLLQHAA